VYRVWDLKRNVPLAMKVLHAELAEDPAVFKRFQREARALQKLAHPNIVPFYGLYHTLDFAFLLERYIDGPNLKDILRQRRGKPLPIKEALTYLKALCAALGYAHANGVIHCDVKPGNVMVDRGGNIYLTDFGIARHAESTTTTMAGAGTSHYMAPEQIRSEAVTPATDVYALGVVLFEMLTGQRPFRGTEAGTEKGGATAGERVRYAHQHLPPPDPHSLNPAIPVGMSSVVLKALEKSPQNRYHDTQEMFLAVCRALGVSPEAVGERVESPRNIPSPSPALIASVPLAATPQVGAGKGKTATPAWIVPAGLISLTGIGILIIALLVSNSRSGGTRQVPIAERIYVTASVTPFGSEGGSPGVNTALSTPAQYIPSTVGVVQPSPTTPPRPSSSMNGQWIAFTYGTAQDSSSPDARYLSMLNLITGEERRLTFDDGGINFPSFSPDGSQIVYTGCKSGDCKLYLLDVFGGTVQKIPGITQKAMWPNWCPQSGSSWIAYEARSSGNNQIHKTDIKTGEITVLTNGPEDGMPAWSPDCSKIVFLRTTGNFDDIFVLDLATGNTKHVVSSPYDEGKPVWSPDGNSLVFTRVVNDTNEDGFVNLNDRADLYMIPAGGGAEIKLTQGQYSVFSPSFSPDGSQIVFIDFVGAIDRQQIYIYTLVTHQFASITEVGAYNHTSWSP